MAELHVAFVDRLAAEALDGYERAARDRADARRALVDLLLGDEVIDPRRLTEAAGDAGWALPSRLRVGIVADGHPAPSGTHVLAGRHLGRSVVLAPTDEPLDGVPVALGPEHAPVDAAASWRGALALAERCAWGDGPRRWDDHLAALVVGADPVAAAALAEHRLAPLADASPARRTLLHETLAAWCRHPGRPQVIADELQLHPQTARYRIARLRERLGDALDDPAARFELELALRAAVA